MKPPPNISQRQARILIVDDERHNRDLLEVMLTPEGFLLVTAASGEEALALVAEQPPDLILLDIMMPGMSGFQVAARIKETLATQNIPVIMITALDDRTSKLRGLSAGAADFLTKPVDRAELSIQVSNLLRLKAYDSRDSQHSQMPEQAAVIAGGAQSAVMLWDPTMKAPLNILHLEDDPADAELIRYALRADGIACAITCVQTQDDFVETLERGGIDLILSDYLLPAFDGISAAEIAHSRWPHIPLIMVSGKLSEERAIESLKHGVTDYVLKDCLPRLVPAVRRAMLEVEARVELRRMEVDSIESQRMEVLGQLAGGIAHDFNNILTVIMGYSELLASGLRPDSPLQKHASQIRYASRRAVGLIRQLLVYSRRQVVQPVVLDLNDVLKNSTELLRRLIDENIEMTIVPGKQIGRVKADSGYLGQVLMNLAINARDAMPNGGKLTITTDNGALDENDVSVYPCVIPGNYVILTVGDTGTGMTEDVKAKLFEAFFTTKPTGKGTGLGLATCQTIVQQSGGHIVVYSEIGLGTTFKIYFPRVDLPLEAAAGPIQIGQGPRGTETVLVVEDERSVRDVACAVLESYGYDVLSASNGKDALRVAREHRGPAIRLVVTDVIMPLMGGKVVAAGLKETYPDIKVLFTSGYMDDTIVPDSELDPDVAFLLKPYTPAILANTVREILDR